MQTLLNIINWLAANYQAVLSGIMAVLTGIIGICMLIPGPEPEATLQKIVDFIAKFSKK